MADLRPDDPATLAALTTDMARLHAEVGRVIVGQDETVHFVLAALLWAQNSLVFL